LKGRRGGGEVVGGEAWGGGGGNSFTQIHFQALRKEKQRSYVLEHAMAQRRRFR